MKTELVKKLRAKEEQVFLDSDNLFDLRELLNCESQHTHTHAAQR